MDVYIARQPIFNKDKQIFGYELLFRNNAVDESYASDGGDQATSKVIMESFYSTGMTSVTGGKPAFVNFTSRLLLENTATLFPKEQLIVEILETVEPTPEIIKACRSLQRKGYRLALDDFIYKPKLKPLIELSRIIKFDFLEHTPQKIAGMMRQVNIKGKWLLAEKIETNELFDLALTMGFKLFQGYFFSRPETMPTKALSPHKISYMSLIRETSMGVEMDFQRVAKVIHDDVALSYKLLRLVNSSYYGLRTKVKDISRAVAIIGANELRKWVFMIALMGLSSDKPDEIIRMSMIRGRFMEKLNSENRWVKSDESAFQTGLFSMLDVLMDASMPSVLEGMHLADEVVEALIDKSGLLYDLLELVYSLERGDWARTDEMAASLNIHTELISEVYVDAIKWCNDLSL